MKPLINDIKHTWLLFMKSEINPCICCLIKNQEDLVIFSSSYWSWSGLDYLGFFSSTEVLFCVFMTFVTHTDWSRAAASSGRWRRRSSWRSPSGQRWSKRPGSPSHLQTAAIRTLKPRRKHLKTGRSRVQTGSTPTWFHRGVTLHVCFIVSSWKSSTRRH